MQLSDYLKREGLSLGEFARLVGASNARTIQRYVKHGRVPAPLMMAAITAATKNAVQPNDFYPAAAE